MPPLVRSGLLTAALLLAACSPHKDLIKYRGGDLKGAISVAEAATVSDGPLLNAKAVLRNDGAWEQKFEYKFVWYDANGLAIDEDERPWHAASLRGHDEMTVSTAAPNPRAKSYKIHVREPQGVTR